jgi:hypothetical protein
MIGSRSFLKKLRNLSEKTEPEDEEKKDPRGPPMF